MLFEKAIVKVLRSLSFLCFAVMIVVVFAQVILRYFFGAPLAWVMSWRDCFWFGYHLWGDTGSLFRCRSSGSNICY